MCLVAVQTCSNFLIPFLFCILGSALAGLTFPAFAIIFAEYMGVYFLPDPAKIREESSFWACMFIVVAVNALISAILQKTFMEWGKVSFLRRNKMLNRTPVCVKNAKEIVRIFYCFIVLHHMLVARFHWFADSQWWPLCSPSGCFSNMFDAQQPVPFLFCQADNKLFGLFDPLLLKT